eukprot:6173129-Pleurochrysis_carterae.AAC.2
MKLNADAAEGAADAPPEQMPGFGRSVGATHAAIPAAGDVAAPVGCVGGCEDAHARRASSSLRRTPMDTPISCDRAGKSPKKTRGHMWLGRRAAGAHARAWAAVCSQGGRRGFAKGHAEVTVAGSMPYRQRNCDEQGSRFASAGDMRSGRRRPGNASATLAIF